MTLTWKTTQSTPLRACLQNEKYRQPLADHPCEPKCHRSLCGARLQDNAVSYSQSPPTEHRGVLYLPADRVLPPEP